jgi:3-hydroxymyristoyl/3-hydroxydecanoyl-(acyl carrier protein) dehydratase/1-acyl-sn-glycerol-3-phosphate acyltransferase
MDAEYMAPAPTLPPFLDESWVGPAAPPAAVAPPPAAVAPPPAVSVIAADTPASKLLAGYHAHMVQLAQGLQDFVLAQQSLHQRFLSVREAAYDSLRHAADVNGSTKAAAVRPHAESLVPVAPRPSTICTETDVTWDSWYLHDAYMPAGVMIESGLTELMRTSVELTGQHVDRLLSCEVTYHGDLPMAGETLRYEIQLNGQDTRLVCFHYDCRSGDRPRLSLRNGRAAFFTGAEPASTDWRPDDREIVAQPQLDPPAVATQRTGLDREQLEAFASGDTFACFGPGFERAQTHTRSPRIPRGRMLLQDRVTHLEQQGGPWRRGYLRAEFDITHDLCFFAGSGPCLPETVIFDGCLQAQALFLASRGYSIDRDGWRFQPVPEIAYQLEWGGPITATAGRLVTEVFVEEVIAEPKPIVYADLLATVDGRQVFRGRGVALQLVPDWPLEAMPDLVAEADSDRRPVAEVDGFRFDYASLLAGAWGKPSHMLGPMYSRFDGPTRVPRIPGPPFLFMSRIKELDGPIGVMKPGAKVSVDYDIPPDAWYFDANGNRSMPFGVLVEAVLQACGWLSFYVGSALTVEQEVGVRNLDGAGTLHCEVLPDSGTLTTHAELVEVSVTDSMIIETFEVRCLLGDTPVYDLRTVFGFFPPAALASQVGLPTTDSHRELLTRASGHVVDLTARPHPHFAAERAQLAQPMLLMIDRVDGFWPGAGDAGLGQLRAVKDIDPGEWFFKAHFFQDPVQPGSLGITAMIQALQFYMLETRMDDGIPHPRFECLATQREMSWKYRGQVLPQHRKVHTTLEVTRAGRDEHGAYAECTASLWADGQRIYEAVGLGMRIVPGRPEDGGRTAGVEITLDPAHDTWVADHCPTFTVPALPMMGIVDLLACGSTGAGPVVAIRDVRLSGWLLVDRLRRLTSECSGEDVRLFDEDGREVARARVIHGTYREKPAALPPIDGPEQPLPYQTGALPHGPAFQVLAKLVMGRGASSSVLHARSGVPVGLLNPALLDGALHGIPHADMHTWNDAYSVDKVAYPAFIPKIEFFGPTPAAGVMRCEVRERPFLGTPDYPASAIQLIGDDGVWCQFELVESCFPKGPLVAAEPIQRRAFMRDRLPVDGLRLSHAEGAATLLDDADVQGLDWLPGTVDTIYGTRETEEVARREHVAAAHGLHPGRALAQLPLTRFDLPVVRTGSQVRVEGDGRGQLDIGLVRDFWARWFGCGPWPVEDLVYGLIERFLDRVVLEAPEAYEALHGRSMVYLANHQTGLESLIFSVVASGLNQVPTVTLAKIEHRETWLGRLIRHCFQFPGVSDPTLMTFFDRDDKASLPRIIAELAAEMIGPGRSVMVHVEGTRSLSCRPPVQKMSGAFIDLALAVSAPIVPVRFIGGLSADPVEKRLEFPFEMGRQEIRLGRPMLPDELAALHYGARKQRVIDAINALGVPNELEQPLSGDPQFAGRVLAWQRRTGVSHEHATLREVLAGLPAPGEPIRRLLSASTAEELADASPDGQWLAELGRRVLGEGSCGSPSW